MNTIPSPVCVQAAHAKPRQKCSKPSSQSVSRSARRKSRPNPSLKRSANGRPPGPGLRYAVHFLSPGPGVLPSSPA